MVTLGLCGKFIAFEVIPPACNALMSTNVPSVQTWEKVGFRDGLQHVLRRSGFTLLYNIEEGVPGAVSSVFRTAASHMLPTQANTQVVK